MSKISEEIICSQCNEAQTSDSDSLWEDGNGGELCQMCWESTSDAEWWNRLRDIEIQIHNQIKT